MSLTKDQGLEVLACAQDAFHFIDNYAYIQHPIHGAIRFSMWDWQREELSAWLQHRSNIVLKARGIGFSWLAATYSLWRVMLKLDPLWLFASRRGEDAEELVGKVWFVYDHLPDWLQVPVTDARSTRFELEGGESRILSQTANAGLGRNYHASGVVLDEFAFLPYDEQIWRSLAPTLEHGGQMLAGSTPNGLGNSFHRLYTAASEGSIDFRAPRYLYGRVPGHDEAWLQAEAQEKGLTKTDIAQEHLCDFLQSGRPVFDADDVKACMTGTQYHLTRGRRKGLHIVAIDPADMGGDSTSVSVLDAGTGEGVYHEQFEKPVGAGLERCAYLLSIFPGKAVVEKTGLGMAYCEGLPGCIRVATTASDSETKDGEGSWKVGKGQLIHPLIRACEEHELVLCDEQTRNQMIVFQYLDNGKMAAPPGYHDDAVMSLAIGRWAYGKKLVKAKSNRNTKSVTDVYSGVFKNRRQSRRTVRI